jgi:phosphoribosylformylglycinamidine synthase subunit PurQ / glutaminase
MDTKALILHATGTNRDHDAAQALELAGAHPEIVHINQLRSGERKWSDYQILVVPGGFSYADALGAGKLLALDLKSYFSDEVREFVERGKPVIGICNGFQALVKAGVLPGISTQPGQMGATLTFNARGHFECRWVRLIPLSQKCVWTRGLVDGSGEPVLIECPVAHGEGNFIPGEGVFEQLKQQDQVALRYARAFAGTGINISKGNYPADLAYPDNPNGSAFDIAGVCNP